MPRNHFLLLAGLILCLGAASGALRSQQQAVWLGPDRQPLPFRSHDDVLEFLSTARVIHSEEIPGSQNHPLKLLLEKNGVRAHAVFRKVNRTWRREWVRGTWYLHLVDRAASERAAYVVARQLGIDNVPPTVLRELDGREGSLQLWLESAESLADLVERHGQPPDRWVDQMVAIHVFDSLVYNVDRHPGNILICADDSVWMIDHTLAFQHEDRLLDTELRGGITAMMWERLQAIPDAEFAGALADALSDDQIDAFLARRRQLVALIEERIAELGRDRVVRGHPVGAQSDV